MAMAESERLQNDIDIEGYDRRDLSFKEPLLLQKNRINTTSQIAIVGANVCSIESLDYEYVA